VFCFQTILPLDSLKAKNVPPRVPMYTRPSAINGGAVTEPCTSCDHRSAPFETERAWILP
jgi:hypothetical protein